MFVDTLRLSADEGDRSRPVSCNWVVMASRSTPIRSSCGTEVNPTSSFRPPKEFDYIAVVGGIMHHGQKTDDETIAYLHAAARQQVSLIGICTGSFLLSRIGLMKNRKVCISWLHYQEFCEEFPGHEVSADRLFEVDGDRITCAGGAASADLAIYLVERHLGQSAAQKPHHVLLLERVRTVASVQPHPPIACATVNVHIRRAMLLMEQHLSSPLQISSIAATLSLSTRQLERLFRAELLMRPSIFYRILRLRYARWLLSHTSRSVTEIALDAGFSDGAHFSRQFKAVHGCAPSSLRANANIISETHEIPEIPRGFLQQQVGECAGRRIF